MRQSDQSFDMILVKQVTFSSGVMMRTTWRQKHPHQATSKERGQQKADYGSNARVLVQVAHHAATTLPRREIKEFEY